MPDRPQKITFADMRNMGVRAPLRRSVTGTGNGALVAAHCREAAKAGKCSRASGALGVS